MTDYVVHSPEATTTYGPGIFVAQVINTIVGIIEALLLLRLILELLGANPTALFVAWIFGLTNPLIAPFAGAFPNWFVGGFALDIATIFAMVGYAILGWLLVRLLSFMFVRP